MITQHTSWGQGAKNEKNIDVYRERERAIGMGKKIGVKKNTTNRLVDGQAVGSPRQKAGAFIPKGCGSNSRNNRVRRGKRKDYADKGDELHLNIAPRPTGSLGVPLPDAPGRGSVILQAIRHHLGGLVTKHTQLSPGLLRCGV